MSKTLHFNFTPVQTFVAQARRTRDLWAGSYLLSWLSGQAMAAIIHDGGKVQMPFISDDLLIKAIQDPKNATSKDSKEKFSLAQSIGSLPNRFTAEIPDTKDPNAYADVIQKKWQHVAASVRDKIDPNRSLMNDSFWNRQINNHWEFAWAIGDESNLLDTRKNLRLPRLNEESGEKCTVCGERQELFDSSDERQTLSKTKDPLFFPPDRKGSNKWWAQFKESDLDIRENERLCAVCLTKRLFPLVAKQAIDWEVEKYYPSTAYLSAIDWLEEVLKKAKSSSAIQETVDALTDTAQKLNLYNSEYNTRINSLSVHLKGSGVKPTFIDLDGDVFYLSSITADQLQKRGSNKTLSTPEKQKLSSALKKLQKAVGASATPFYALLLMDGDGMGKLISGRSQTVQGNISQALSKFTKQVPEIIKERNGKLIYAGGDDVFALLPVSTAVKCAAECRVAYQQAFKHFPEDIKKAATISAAVQFAHQNIALSVVVKDAHRLLDDIAKDRTGRDALACRVWKPGGAVLTWSQPWQVEHNGNLIEITNSLNQVLNDFNPSKQTDRFSSKFFYKLRDLFELIQSEATLTASVQDLLVAEYLANREHQEKDPEATKNRIANLLLLCQQQTRIIDENHEISYRKGAYNADAALLVRFLVQKEL